MAETETETPPYLFFLYLCKQFVNEYPIVTLVYNTGHQYIVMELDSKYDPSKVEDKWYKYWMDNHLFHSEPDGREPYTIVIPPPNVTGVLHMGHMLNNTIQDILIRRARMLGKNACWVPGTDHASIATEAKVVGKLAAQGINKKDLTRDQFLEHAWDWTREHGGIILEQLKKLGASCDWDRTCFTMDEARSKSVIRVFVDLYNKGLIYRGVRMVNWDPKALTALSDEEVIYKEQQGKLYYLRYKIVGESGYAIVATTRPETIFGDTAMCINPTDQTKDFLRGKKVVVPLVGREIPVIEDEIVDKEFGTGCLKVTPAHSVDDYILGEKYNIPIIDVFNDNGTLNGNAGERYCGKDRFEVRELIEKDLQEAGLLEKIEPYTNNVGFSERTNVVIEPKLSMQWFLKMDEIVKPALEAVMNDTIQLHPAKFKNTYRHWMENVRDWCISRQLWWGHRIPAYFLPEGGFVVAESAEEALVKAKEKTGNDQLTLNDLTQDSDCLDTWFSSWLWPISVFDGINNPNNPDINYYYPTCDLVTGPDILFFWVARMIISGYIYRQQPCFRDVYLTGIVRDKLGRKMSKSLGNSPDPISLMNQYGADGVRMGMMLAAPAGNDILFDESLCEQGRNFCNKMWNAIRLVQVWKSEDIEQPQTAITAINWFNAILNKTIEEVDDLFSKYRISEALMVVYRLFWDEFSGWYLETIKPEYGSPIDNKTYQTTLGFFETLLKLIHPFMPFITEELYHQLRERDKNDCIMTSTMPKASNVDQGIIDRFDIAKQVVTNIRSVRKNKNIANKVQLSLEVIGTADLLDDVIRKMGNLKSISSVQEKKSTATSFIVGTTEFQIPLEDNIDVDSEIKKMEREIQYLQGFLASVMKKLSNERFVQNAKPEIVEVERKKKADAEQKIKVLSESIAALKK